MNIGRPANFFHDIIKLTNFCLTFYCDDAKEQMNYLIVSNYFLPSELSNPMAMSEIGEVIFIILVDR